MTDEIIKVAEAELPVNEELIIQKHRLKGSNGQGKRICVVTGIHGDELEGQYVANNLHFAAAIALILMVILLVCMALLQRVANKQAAA